MQNEINAARLSSETWKWARETGMYSCANARAGCSAGQGWPRKCLGAGRSLCNNANEGIWRPSRGQKLTFQCPLRGTQHTGWWVNHPPPFNKQRAFSHSCSGQR